VLRPRRLVALAAATALAVPASQARAASTNCAVNASGGFANCLALSNPAAETAKANHASGTPYKVQFARLSDGARWGPWTYNDLNYHFFGLAPGGVITTQIDNQGTGNPSSYYVELN
jgi:hypothetical protein